MGSHDWVVFKPPGQASASLGDGETTTSGGRRGGRGGITHAFWVTGTSTSGWQGEEVVVNESLYYFLFSYLFFFLTPPPPLVT